jgi:hypothetical protein
METVGVGDAALASPNNAKHIKKGMPKVRMDGAIATAVPKPDFPVFSINLSDFQIKHLFPVVFFAPCA